MTKYSEQTEVCAAMGLTPEQLAEVQNYVDEFLDGMNARGFFVGMGYIYTRKDDARFVGLAVSDPEHVAAINAVTITLRAHLRNMGYHAGNAGPVPIGGN